MMAGEFEDDLFADAAAGAGDQSRLRWWHQVLVRVRINA
jgi:hypothetical protein